MSSVEALRRLIGIAQLAYDNGLVDDSLASELRSARAALAEHDAQPAAQEPVARRLCEMAHWCLIEGNGDDEVHRALLAGADEIARLTERLAPAAQPVGWKWAALKDGEVTYQFGEHCPDMFRKTAVPLFAGSQPAPAAPQPDPKPRWFDLGKEAP